MNLYNISSYLLDEIKANSELAKDAMTCDVVFTTGDHYFDLQKNIPELEEKLVEVLPPGRSRRFSKWLGFPLMRT